MMDGMNAKWKLFIDHYLGDSKLDPTDAYTKAGYKATGHGLETNASRLLNNAEVQAEIKRRMDASSARMGLTTDRVLKELERVAFSDPRKLYRPDGTLKAPHEWDDDTAAAIAGVETVEVSQPVAEEQQDAQPHGGSLARRRTLSSVIVRTNKVKRWDKNAALLNAMKHLGMLKEDSPHPDRQKHDLERLTPDERTALLAALRSLFAPRHVGPVGAAGGA